MQDNNQHTTTAIWTLDTFTLEYGWRCPLARKPEAFSNFISMFDESKPTALILEANDKGAQFLRSTAPEHVTVFDSYSDYRFFIRRKHAFEMLIIVSPRIYPEQGVHAIQYFPRTLHLGVGCQRHASVTMAKHILHKVEKEGFCIDSIATIGSIEDKKNEPLLTELRSLCSKADLFFFPAAELAKMPIPNPSDKVFESSGCYGVAESAALICATNGKVVMERVKCKVPVGDKIQHYTLAIAQSY